MRKKYCISDKTTSMLSLRTLVIFLFSCASASLQEEEIELFKECEIVSEATLDMYGHNLRVPLDRRGFDISRDLEPALKLQFENVCNKIVTMSAEVKKCCDDAMQQVYAFLRGSCLASTSESLERQLNEHSGIKFEFLGVIEVEIRNSTFFDRNVPSNIKEAGMRAVFVDGCVHYYTELEGNLEEKEHDAEECIEGLMR